MASPARATLVTLRTTAFVLCQPAPLLHDGALYVQALHGMRTEDPSYVLRIDAATGETLWREERPPAARQESPESYTTPADSVRLENLALKQSTSASPPTR